jgi:Holliday junction DNA helicase RuvA
MISYISGTILSKQRTSITVLTSAGLGYDVTMSTARALEQSVGADISLYTYLRVTDSAHTLFGFFSVAEKAFFELLLSVSGVGPKSAMNILAIGSIDEISAAIGRKDVKYLTAVQGMGKKTAERLVVELQNKVVAVAIESDDAPDGSVLSEVIEALIAMGYQKTEAVAAAKQLNTEDKPTELLLREALRLLN